eukprot:ctg_129.g71
MSADKINEVRDAGAHPNDDRNAYALPRSLSPDQPESPNTPYPSLPHLPALAMHSLAGHPSLLCALQASSPASPIRFLSVQTELYAILWQLGAFALLRPGLRLATIGSPGARTIPGASSFFFPWAIGTGRHGRRGWRSCRPERTAGGAGQWAGAGNGSARHHPAGRVVRVDALALGARAAAILARAGDGQLGEPAVHLFGISDAGFGVQPVAGVVRGAARGGVRHGVRGVSYGAGAIAVGQAVSLQHHRGGSAADRVGGGRGGVCGGASARRVSGGLCDVFAAGTAARFSMDFQMKLLHRSGVGEEAYFPAAAEYAKRPRGGRNGAVHRGGAVVAQDAYPRARHRHPHRELFAVQSDAVAVGHARQPLSDEVQRAYVQFGRHGLQRRPHRHRLGARPVAVPPAIALPGGEHREHHPKLVSGRRAQHAPHQHPVSPRWRCSAAEQPSVGSVARQVRPAPHRAHASRRRRPGLRLHLPGGGQGRHSRRAPVQADYGSGCSRSLFHQPPSPSLPPPAALETVCARFSPRFRPLLHPHRWPRGHRHAGVVAEADAARRSPESLCARAVRQHLVGVYLVRAAVFRTQRQDAPRAPHLADCLREWIQVQLGGVEGAAAYSP